MDTTYKDRLTKHIEALEKSCDNLIEILNEDVEKDEEGKIKLKDLQKKTFAEGISKSAETATALLLMIKEKKTELEGLDNEKIKPKDKTHKKVEVSDSSGKSRLNKHLN